MNRANDLAPNCINHASTDDAFYITKSLASFLQLATKGMMEDMAREGKPEMLFDAIYGMEHCFTLLQDMIAIAEKESMPAEVENA